MKWKNFMWPIGITCWCYTVLNHGVHLAVMDGYSMAPTLNSSSGDHDLVLFESITRLTQNFKRGQVVQLMDPEAPRGTIVKRIIAMEGDKIPSNRVNSCLFRKVPRGHIWIEGDNANMSYDSRHYGPVPLALVHSKAVYRIWPLSKCGYIR